MGMGQKNMLQILWIKAQAVDGIDQKIQILHHCRIDQRQPLAGLDQKAPYPGIPHIPDPRSHPERLDGHLPGHGPGIIYSIHWRYLYFFTHDRYHSFLFPAGSASRTFVHYILRQSKSHADQNSDGIKGQAEQYRKLHLLDDIHLCQLAGQVRRSHQRGTWIQIGNIHTR